MRKIRRFLLEQVSMLDCVVTTALGDKIKIKCDVVNTPDKITQGLMGRKDLPQNEGMLFIFPNETNHEFWMKNTIIPLDIIFIRDDKYITGIIEDAKPGSMKLMSVDSPSRYVIEVNAGFCRKNGIRMSDTVGFRE